jgi:hypothetical protein
MRLIFTTSTLCNIHYTVAVWIARIQAMARDQGFECSWFPIIGRPSEWLMNTAADYAKSEVNGKKFDWWLHMDSDNPPRRDPLELMQFDKPLICLPTPMVNPHRVENLRVTKWNIVPSNPRTGLQKVEWGGSGCFLAQCKYLKHLDTPLFRWGYVGSECLIMSHSPDVGFCHRWYDAGYDVWTHWDYPCDHWRDNLNLYRVAKVEDEFEEYKRNQAVSPGSVSGDLVDPNHWVPRVLVGSSEMDSEAD